MPKASKPGGDANAGVRQGRAVADLLAAVLSAHAADTHELRIEERVRAQQLYHELYEPTLIDSLRPLLEQLHDDPATHVAVKQAAADMLAGKGQIQGVMLSFVLPLLLGIALAPVLEPVAVNLNRQAWEVDFGTPVDIQGKPISPADLASMVVQGFMSESDATSEAQMSGVRPYAFANLVDINGNPPGPGDLLTMYRRGIIPLDSGDPAAPGLLQGLRQGRTKDQWIEPITELALQLLTPAELVSATVQNHIAYGDAETKAAEWGIDAGDFAIMYATAGRPIATGEALQLYRRGLVDAAFVQQAIRESDIKDKYVDDVLLLHTAILPTFQVVTLLKSGEITPQLAAEQLTDSGFPPEVVAAVVSGAQSPSVAKAKQLTESVIDQLYTDRLLSRDQAQSMLTAEGYSPAEAVYLLDVQDMKLEAHYLTTAVGAIHTQYVNRRIPQAEADVLLSQLEVAEVQRVKLFALWDQEMAARVRLPTAAQIVAGVKYQLISNTDAITGLEALGYSPDHAAFVLDVGLHGPVVPLTDPGSAA